LHGILMKMLLLWRVWTICLCILWIAELFLPPVFEYNWFVYSTMSWVTLAVLLEYNLFVYVNHRVARFLWCHLFIPAGFNTIFVILWIAEVWWCRYEHVFMYALLLLIMSMCVEVPTWQVPTLDVVINDHYFVIYCYYPPKCDYLFLF
jgi:hypothetical protein